MSVVVAVKDKQFNRYVLGADTQITFGTDYKTELSDGESKIITYQVGDYPKVLFGGVGRYKTLQILSFTKLISADDFIDNPNGFTAEWVFTVLVPRIQSIFLPLGLMTKSSDTEEELCMPNSFLFACEDKCYYITGDGCVHTIDDCWAIGSGAPLALGAIKNCDENPFKKVARAIRSTSEVIISVNDIIDYDVTIDIGKEKDYLATFDFDGVEKYWKEYLEQEETEENTCAALLKMYENSQKEFRAYKDIVKSIVDEDTFTKITTTYIEKEE